jgi:hypothetical protein
LVQDDAMGSFARNATIDAGGRPNQGVVQIHGRHMVEMLLLPALLLQPATSAQTCLAPAGGSSSSSSSSSSRDRAVGCSTHRLSNASRMSAPGSACVASSPAAAAAATAAAAGGGIRTCLDMGEGGCALRGLWRMTQPRPLQCSCAYVPPACTASIPSPFMGLGSSAQSTASSGAHLALGAR